MVDRDEAPDEAAGLAERIAELATAREVTVAVAESLTSGQVASRLGAAPDASSWFVGGVVAYAAHVKFKVLDVDPGPVVTARCAAQMAAGVGRLTGADLAVALTGVGGPGPDEGHPAGTTFLAACRDGDCHIIEERFDGDPAEVVEQATITALKLLLQTLEQGE
ncbi:CinA family protein [Kribbella sp. CA-293567]|uniref:CinA family protein n=1 Tax=Kribbella sp. CA-293567 TaxID=3002436 RepID=UPI0022DE6BB3|nr:CinA family protein [Kribbella sp. CA-293567]WBQ08287.1 CinA family protein [Kribbella sp. CA-293567]